METQTTVVYYNIGSGILIKLYRKKRVLHNVEYNELLLLCIIVIIIYWYNLVKSKQCLHCRVYQNVVSLF